MREYLKTILLVLAVLSVGGGLYLGYGFMRDHPFYSSNPDLAELERFERAHDYPSLINALYKKREGTAFSTSVLPWLKERESKDFAPYLYATALHLILLDQPDDAMLYYFRAGLLARIDLLRCADSTAEQVVMQLESPFKDVQDYLGAHPGAKVTSGTLALLKEEESLPVRGKPDWLCLYGEHKLNPYIAYIDDAEWMKRRQETRDSFKFLISERPDKYEYPELFHSEKLEGTKR
jgi:hypothetical protein